METRLASYMAMRERNRHPTRTAIRKRGRPLRFIRRWVPAPGEAEDLLQDVFFELVEAYRLPDPIGQVGDGSSG
jgi:DNA-directed RNA polymerase specialized sigma24 family protein